MGPLRAGETRAGLAMDAIPFFGKKEAGDPQIPRR